MGIIQDLIGPQIGTVFVPSFPFNDLGFFCPVTPSLCTKDSVPIPNPFFVANTGTQSNIESTVRHVGSHLLEFEFLRELLVELLQLSDELTASLDDGGFGRDLTVGVDAKLKGRKERMRDLVGGEGDVIHAVQFVAEHVGEGVILFVESEQCGVGDLCIFMLDIKMPTFDVDVV